jgi:hypothetical protein
MFLRSNNSKLRTLNGLKIGFEIESSKKAVVTPAAPNKLVMIGMPIIKKLVRNIEWDITACVDISLVTRRELTWPYINKIRVMINKVSINLKFKKSSILEL